MGASPVARPAIEAPRALSLPSATSEAIDVDVPLTVTPKDTAFAKRMTDFTRPERPSSTLGALEPIGAPDPEVLTSLRERYAQAQAEREQFRGEAAQRAALDRPGFWRSLGEGIGLDKLGVIRRRADWQKAGAEQLEAELAEKQEDGEIPSVGRYFAVPIKNRVLQFYEAYKTPELASHAEKAIEAEVAYRIRHGLIESDEVKLFDFDEWFGQLPEKIQDKWTRQGFRDQHAGSTRYETGVLEDRLHDELLLGLPFLSEAGFTAQQDYYRALAKVTPEQLPPARGIMRKMAEFAGGLTPFLVELGVLRRALVRPAGRLGRAAVGRPVPPAVGQAAETGATFGVRAATVPEGEPMREAAIGAMLPGAQALGGRLGSRVAGLREGVGRAAGTGAVFGGVAGTEEGSTGLDVFIAGVVAPAMFHAADMIRHPFRPRALVPKPYMGRMPSTVEELGNSPHMSGRLIHRMMRLAGELQRNPQDTGLRYEFRQTGQAVVRRYEQGRARDWEGFEIPERLLLDSFVRWNAPEQVASRISDKLVPDPRGLRFDEQLTREGRDYVFRVEPPEWLRTALEPYGKWTGERTLSMPHETKMPPAELSRLIWLEFKSRSGEMERAAGVREIRAVVRRPEADQLLLNSLIRWSSPEKMAPLAPNEVESIVRRYNEARARDWENIPVAEQLLLRSFIRYSPELEGSRIQPWEELTGAKPIRRDQAIAAERATPEVTQEDRPPVVREPARRDVVEGERERRPDIQREPEAPRAPGRPLARAPAPEAAPEQVEPPPAAPEAPKVPDVAEFARLRNEVTDEIAEWERGQRPQGGAQLFGYFAAITTTVEEARSIAERLARHGAIEQEKASDYGARLTRLREDIVETMQRIAGPAPPQYASPLAIGHLNALRDLLNEAIERGVPDVIEEVPRAETVRVDQGRAPEGAPPEGPRAERPSPVARRAREDIARGEGERRADIQREQEARRPEVAPREAQEGVQEVAPETRIAPTTDTEALGRQALQEIQDSVSGPPEAAMGPESLRRWKLGFYEPSEYRALETQGQRIEGKTLADWRRGLVSELKRLFFMRSRELEKKRGIDPLPADVPYLDVLVRNIKETLGRVQQVEGSEPPRGIRARIERPGVVSAPAPKPSARRTATEAALEAQRPPRTSDRPVPGVSRAPEAPEPIEGRPGAQMAMGGEVGEAGRDAALAEYRKWNRLARIAEDRPVRPQSSATDVAEMESHYPEVVERSGYDEDQPEFFDALAAEFRERARHALKDWPETLREMLRAERPSEPASAGGAGSISEFPPGPPSKAPADLMAGLNPEQRAWLRKLDPSHPGLGLGAMANVPDPRGVYKRSIDALKQRLENAPFDKRWGRVVHILGEGLYGAKWGLDPQAYRRFAQVEGAKRMARSDIEEAQKYLGQRLNRFLQQGETAGVGPALRYRQWERRMTDVFEERQPPDILNEEDRAFYDGVKSRIDALTRETLKYPEKWLSAFGLQNIHEVIKHRMSGEGTHLRALYVPEQQIAPMHIARKGKVAEVLRSPRIRGGIYKVRRSDLGTRREAWTLRYADGTYKQFFDENEAKEAYQAELDAHKEKLGASRRQKIKLLDPFDRETTQSLEPIVDLGARIAATLVTMEHNLATLRLFDYLATTHAAPTDPDNPDAPPRKGWLRLADHPTLGPLRNQWVSPHVWRNLNSYDRVSSGLLSRLWHTFNYAWKSSRVTWNLRTWVNNILGNHFFMALDGVSPYSHPLFYVRAAKEIRNRGPVWRRLVRENRINVGWSKSVNADFEEYLNIADNPTEAIGRWVQDNVRRLARANERVGNAYDMPDQLAIVASYMAKVAPQGEGGRGMSHEEALDSLWTYPNYAEPGEAARWARKHPFGSSFILFTEQSIKIALRAMRDRPGRLLALYGFPGAITAFTIAMFGLTDEELEIINQDPRRKGRLGPERWVNRYFQPLVPLRNEDGELQWIDLRWKMPLADNFRVEQGPGGIGIPFLFETPVARAAIELASGYDLWTGKPVSEGVVNPDIDQARLLYDHLKNVAGELLPLPSMVSRSFQNVYRTWVGDSERSYGEALAAGIFGVELKDPYVRREDAFRAIKNALDDKDADLWLRMLDLYNTVYRAEYARPIHPKAVIRAKIRSEHTEAERERRKRERRGRNIRARVRD
jgi:hypothetical protein